jgi:hypothetical protein
MENRRIYCLLISSFNCEDIGTYTIYLHLVALLLSLASIWVKIQFGCSSLHCLDWKHLGFPLFPIFVRTNRWWGDEFPGKTDMHIGMPTSKTGTSSDLMRTWCQRRRQVPPVTWWRFWPTTSTLKTRLGVPAEWTKRTTMDTQKNRPNHTATRATERKWNRAMIGLMRLGFNCAARRMGCW